MSVKYSDFQGEVVSTVKKFPFYSTVANPVPPAAVNAELATLGAALATDTSTHSKLIEHPPAALVVGGAGHSAFTTLMNLLINKAKGGNLPNASIQAAIDGVAGVLAPPGVVDVPYVSGPGAPGTGAVGQVLNCTNGNWVGTPTSYAYQWKRDGTTNIGTSVNTYTLVAGDSGHRITCVVTATNATGSTTAPPSNAIACA